MPNMETCAHADINILCNEFWHCLQIGHVLLLYTLDMLFMSKELSCLFVLFCLFCFVLFVLLFLSIWNLVDIKLVKA